MHDAFDPAFRECCLFVKICVSRKRLSVSALEPIEIKTKENSITMVKLSVILSAISTISDATCIRGWLKNELLVTVHYFLSITHEMQAPQQQVHCYSNLSESFQRMCLFLHSSLIFFNPLFLII